jgi:hypothetical protein
VESSSIEPEFHAPYTAWKTTPGLESNAALLSALKPTIAGAIKTHVGENNPLIESRARKLVLDTMHGYAPDRGRLSSYVYSQLQGLKRINRQQTSILKTPERVAQDGYYLSQAGKELQSELGREPTDSELADKTGLSFKRMHKVRQYHAPVSEGQIVDPETGMSGYSGAINNPWQQKRHSAWTHMVYDDLDPYHQQIMEHTLGMNGRRALNNIDLAKRLGKSPGAISQAKARIQTMLDQGEELSPFGGA